MQRENHTRQELEVEWKGIDRITEHPELGGIKKDHPVELMPLLIGLLWNYQGSNLTPFGLKHQQISSRNLALGEGEIKTGSSHHFPFLTGGLDQGDSRLLQVPCFLLMLLQSLGHYTI